MWCRRVIVKILVTKQIYEFKNLFFNLFLAVFKSILKQIDTAEPP